MRRVAYFSDQVGAEISGKIADGIDPGNAG
jgi:hypothetical protein